MNVISSNPTIGLVDTTEQILLSKNLFMPPFSVALGTVYGARGVLIASTGAYACGYLYHVDTSGFVLFPIFALACFRTVKGKVTSATAQ